MRRGGGDCEVGCFGDGLVGWMDGWMDVGQCSSIDVLFFLRRECICMFV